MLTIEVPKIPPDGIELDEPLDPGGVHVAGESAFTLLPGGALRCRVERGDDDAVHVSGRLDARLTIECGRCALPFAFDVGEDLDLFYLPWRPGAAPEEEEEEVELGDHDVVVAYYRDERLDLGEIVREQLFLALPLRGLCREDCRGLCPSCGADRNTEAECGCPRGEEDPAGSPFSVLGRLLPPND